MVQRLNNSDSGFELAFAAFLNTKREASQDVNDAVRAILDDVRVRGDVAVADYTQKFDNLDVSGGGMRVPDAELTAAFDGIDSDTRSALELAHERITSHHKRQLPKDDHYTDALGVELGSRWTAVEAAGLYVPGGTAAYPSSVLMNAVPAKVAGVPRLAMVVPTPNGEVNPLVFAAAKLAGVDEVYRIGGAQAVAALAYGTESIAPVAKIVGPGNAYVAAAKRQVFGTVGIDMVAGPSEVLIIADGDNDPAWVAADLLAQAEHDANAQSVLITDDAAFGDAVAEAVAEQLADLPRGNIAGDSWQNYGAVIVVDDIAQTVGLADRFAAEHLEISTKNADELAGRIRNAGAIFIGHHTPEAIGDYVSGSNHVLPTADRRGFHRGLARWIS